jgi:hypothetical protein
VPAVYYVAPEADAVIQLLTAHGVRLERLAAAEQRSVERFVIDSSTQPRNEFQGHRERTLYGRWQAADAALAAGTVVVSTRQPLGRLAFTLLEPRSDDGIVDWNVVDDAIAKGHYPVLRGF